MSEALSEAEKARSARQLERARALRASRVLQDKCSRVENKKVIDTGGGFLLEPEEQTPLKVLPQPSAPSERVVCAECQQTFYLSYLQEHFGCSVCDDCRDEEGEHALLTRTAAKADFLLRDCDLDSREPPLRFISRRNPHRATSAPMRLYLRSQIESRAVQVWGSLEALSEQKRKREQETLQRKRRRFDREVGAMRKALRPTESRSGGCEHQWTDRPLGDERMEQRCDRCGLERVIETM